MIRYSTGAAVGTVALVASSRLDQVLLPAQIDPRQLGLYAVAVTVAEVPMVVSTLAARQLLTSASRGATIRETAGITAGFLSVIVAICILLGSTAHIFVPAFFGAAFSDAIAPIRLLCVGTVLGSVAVLLSTLTTGRGRPLLGSASAAVALALTIALFLGQWGRVDAWTASVIAVASQGAAAVVAAVVVIAVSRRPLPAPVVQESSS